MRLRSQRERALIKKRGSKSLEEAFISYLQDAMGEQAKSEAATAPLSSEEKSKPANIPGEDFFSLRRMSSYVIREALELRRDPIRLSLSLLGSVVLMITFAVGITLDIENLSFAVLDRDQTILSQDYALNIAGSRYFSEQPPLQDYADMDRRMRGGDVSLAIEIPPDFAKDLSHDEKASIGAWIDGAMPRRGEIVRGYVLGMHLNWLEYIARKEYGAKEPGTVIESRFKYNPDVKSVPAMVPGVIPLLLLLIPAILSTLSVVREKELGSIVNFYVTPVSRLEFLVGKLIPYVFLGMCNFLCMVALATLVFNVPVKGSFLTLSIGTLLYVGIATSLGQVISTITRTQVAAIFATSLATLLPAVHFSGLIDPVSTLEGYGAVIGEISPMTYFLNISRGAFSKGLGFDELRAAFVPLLLELPILIALGVAMLKKQET